MPTDLILPPKSKRLLELDKLLRQGKPGKPFDFMLAHLRTFGFRVSRRTLNRDIQTLRKQGADIKVEYSQGEEAKLPHWYYTDPSWTLSPPAMTLGMFQALLIAQHAMEQYTGLPIAGDIRQAIETAWPVFTREVSRRRLNLVPIRFTTQAEPQLDRNVWRAVVTATLKRRRIRISYVKGWGNKQRRTTTRDVAPYHIVNLQGAWYLLGSASRKDESSRQYALSRIKSVEILKETIGIPEWFDIDAIIRNSFGQFLGKPEDAVKVQVRFSAEVAPLIESRRFSATEERRVLDNGDIVVSFLASPAGPKPYYNVKSWVLSWGTGIEVLGPQPLKDEVDKEVAALAAKHSAATSAATATDRPAPPEEA